MVLASGLYFRERSSTLYTVITAGKVVKVSSHAVGRTAMVKLGSATDKTAIVELKSAAGKAASCRLAVAKQQGVGSAAKGISQKSGGSAVPASNSK